MSDAIQTAILAAFSAALERAISQAVATHVEDLQARLDHTINVLELRTQRIAALETKLTEADLFTKTATITVDEARMVEALNSQEWFWEKLQNRIDAATESAIDTHLEGYDHDSYDSVVSAVEDVDLDDLVTKDDVNDAVRAALDGLRVTLYPR